MKTKVVSVKDLSDHTLVGEYGGKSLITGDVSKSSVMQGCYAVETEHGTLYLDEDIDVIVVDPS